MSVKIGNIVTTSGDWFGEEYLVTDNESKCFKNLPTLHIGYRTFKSVHPTTSILNFKYGNHEYWTFNKKEDRGGYVSGLSKFKLDSMKSFLSMIDYTFVDPFELDLSEIKELIKLCKENKIYTFFYSEKIIYISIGNRILGLDLELLNFIGLNINKLILKLKSLKNNVLLNSKVIIIYDDYLDLFDNQVKLIPYLYSLDEGKKKAVSYIRT